MKGKLSDYDIILLESFTKYFRIYHENIKDKNKLKDYSRKLFFELCEDHDIDKKSAIDYFSKEFTRLDSRPPEDIISRYDSFDDFGSFIEYDEK